LSVAASTITVSSLTLAAGNTFTITSATPAAADQAPPAFLDRRQTWQTRRSRRPTDRWPTRRLAQHHVYAADGRRNDGLFDQRRLRVADRTHDHFTLPTHPPAASPTDPYRRRPAGWSAPSTTSNAAGYSTSSARTLSVAAGTITVALAHACRGQHGHHHLRRHTRRRPGATATSTIVPDLADPREVDGERIAGQHRSVPSITVYGRRRQRERWRARRATSREPDGRTITWTYRPPPAGCRTAPSRSSCQAAGAHRRSPASAAGFKRPPAPAPLVSKQTITVSSLPSPARDADDHVRLDRSAGPAPP